MDARSLTGFWKRIRGVRVPNEPACLLAARVIQDIRGRCDILLRHPAAGDDRSELGPNLRGFPVDNYLIF